MKIKRISIIVSTERAKITMAEYECKKTKNGYIANVKSSFGGKTTRIKDDDILNVNSMSYPGLCRFIEMNTWYFESDEENAKSIVFNALLKIAIQQSEIASKLLIRLNDLKI